MSNHFYIHIPFCNQKCPYCKFALTPIFDEIKKRRYIEYLKKEIKTYFQLHTHNQSDKTIYFGGGTPSILTHSEIQDVLDCFPFYRTIPTEITLESNPEDITAEYVAGLINMGINRLSMGIQTLNDNSLREIHRSDKNSIIYALDNIKQATHNRNISVNVDFILGLPYTKKGETLDAIKFIHANYPNINHTSVYMLEDEDYPKHWKSASIGENEIQDEFISIMDYFEAKGWHHYELSNFSQKGFESRHNRAYWNHSNSRGFGLSSSSYENKKRWNNASSFQGYYGGKVENEELLDSSAIEIEQMMFGLRTHGWTPTHEQMMLHRNTIETLGAKNYIKIEKDTIKMTKTGIFLIDHIMGELL